MLRPMGFEEFISRQGFHTVYLVTPEIGGSPVKVGVASDPYSRLSSHQSSNFISLRLHRFWWVAGRQIAIRVEAAFKEHHRRQCVRGEWFDLPLPEAEAFIEGMFSGLGTWGVSEVDVMELFEHNMRRRSDFWPSGFGIDGLRRR
jgi:predicted GIY-YIG superfamily endonuclease